MNDLRPQQITDVNESQVTTSAERSQVLIAGRKWCCRCEHWVARSGFYANKRTSDGLDPWCTKCRRIYIRDWCRDNNERWKSYRRPEGKSAEYQARHRALHPDRSRVRIMLQRAKENGLILNCCVWPGCAETENIEGHHPDYSRPHEIVSLCNLHHKAVDLCGDKLGFNLPTIDISPWLNRRKQTGFSKQERESRFTRTRPVLLRRFVPGGNKKESTMLLNKHNLKLVAVASEDELRPALQGLHVTDEHTEATDGHILFRMSLPSYVKDDDFPKVKGFEVKKSDGADFTIPTDAAVQLSESLPTKSAMPILGYVQIDPAVEGGVAKYIRVATTDTDVERINRIRLIDVPYPKTDNLFSTDEPAFRIKFNPALLAKALKVAAEFQDKFLPEIILEIPQPKDGDKWGHGALVIRAKNEQGQELTGLVMPMRENKEDEESTP